MAPGACGHAPTGAGRRFGQSCRWASWHGVSARKLLGTMKSGSLTGDVAQRWYERIRWCDADGSSTPAAGVSSVGHRTKGNVTGAPHENHIQASARSALN